MPYTSYGLLKAMRSHTISSPTVAESVQTGRPNACNLCHLDKRSAGRRDARAVVRHASIDLSEDDKTIAASLDLGAEGRRRTARVDGVGDGLAAAQQASGTDWIPAFLSGLFDDPYDAVRFIAYRSMRSQPGSRISGRLRGAARAAPADIERIVNAWRQRQAGSGRRTDAALVADG
jgi:hypothetical protein